LGAAAHALRGRAPRERLPRGRARVGRARGCGARSDLVRSALYSGTLVHSRRTPAEHSFRYPVSYFLVDLNELPELDRRLRLFSWNRPNLLTLHDRDHFDDDARPLKDKVVAFLAEGGLGGDPVLIAAHPRVLG